MYKPFSKYQLDKYSDMEKRILNFWQEDNTFEKSIEIRSKDKAYVFYDGPPFITGLPHHGTLLSSIIKDVIPRYQTMRGYRVGRRWGWDCHGLPAEHFVEKKLNLKDKQAVLDYGLKRYIKACRENMIATGSLWEESIHRIGRWVEFKNAYKTMDAEYMESVWWAFKELYDLGKIYEGEKVLMYCTRCATPVSKAEIAMDNSYKEVVDASVYVKFVLDDDSRMKLVANLNLDLKSDISLIAWTTTPWTLPANSALAVNDQLDYLLVEFEQDFFIVAKDLAEDVLKKDFKQVANFKGSDLVNLKYRPLFENLGDNDCRVLLADYVLAQEGSGIVHLAPAYGEEDYDLAVKYNITVIKNIDDNGKYISGIWQAQNIWQANNIIAEYLYNKGIVFKIKQITHSYPHCHRCQTRLMYKAHASWFLNIAFQKQAMLDCNKDIYWFPKHIKDRRFKDTVNSAPDWNISRDRMWATPIPVWRGVDLDTSEIKTIVVGSYIELEELSGVKLEDYHRPFVDEIEFTKDGVVYKRIDKVLDCWFESGSMPFAQHHYPFENKDLFENNFPADFIAEYVGQVRAWFYYLHAIGVGIFNKPAFKNVIVTGTLLGDDGRKMSKSLGNYTDPLELVDIYSADAYRLVLMNSSVLTAEDFIVTNKELADKQRKLDTLRNTLSFFLLYASADNWQLEDKHFKPPKETQDVLDIWLLARLSQVIQDTTKGLDDYNLPAACQPIIEFIDDLSNWYVRRSRKRFWKTDNDNDKQQAYHCLYYSLYIIAHLIAPICPFLADEMYKNLTQKETSVHLNDWPHHIFEAEDLIYNMSRIRNYITHGLALRAEKAIKVRQPLASFIVTDKNIHTLDDSLKQIIIEELNVKEVIFKNGEFNVALDTHLSQDLKNEGLIRELIRHIQMLRKTTKLEVENRIKLSIQFDNTELNIAVNNFKDYLEKETLAVACKFGKEVEIYPDQAEIKLNNASIIISLRVSSLKK